ncbi:hypothetical protein PoB_000075200 [Plakobranchus ocellatus]|uniref:Uncharacterized protein n=1 Tax=Plakobranchus ocellatus TaxID=259542 RepID=A0AAV3XVU3_9GAST|nr:hypothetical protein PoB_000075200 [Plakobranchus ocellatus]
MIRIWLELNIGSGISTNLKVRARGMPQTRNITVVDVKTMRDLFLVKAWRVRNGHATHRPRCRAMYVVVAAPISKLKLNTIPRPNACVGMYLLPGTPRAKKRVKVV